MSVDPAPPPILVSCAEASGDLLAAGVVAAARARNPSTSFWGIAGERCRQAGVDTGWDVSELSVMGIWEVLPKLGHILNLLRDIPRQAVARGVRRALLVDAPDFNLRLAARLKKQGIHVTYYVSPTVWAWRPGRVHTIRAVVDEMCCILPFEEDWYRDRGVSATFVGHPLLEFAPSTGHVESLRQTFSPTRGGPVLALLPGSRRAEVTTLLPEMLGAVRRLAAEFPGLEPVLARAPTIDRGLIDALCRQAHVFPRVIEGEARTLVSLADAALVASGTASLETALARCPHVVTYRVSWLTEWVFRLFVKATHVALPNIIAGRTVVPELLQQHATAEALAAAIRPLLSDTPERRRMQEGFDALATRLGSPGASDRVAERLLGSGPALRPR